MKELGGRTAIVTGASRGIGVTVASALAQRGVNVAVAARSLPDLERVRSDVAALGVRAIAVACDVTRDEDRRRLVERAEAELGPVDILINNAGVEHSSAFAEEDPTRIMRALEVNLTSAMLLTRAVLPGMTARSCGHIVNMSSLAGKLAAPYQATYSASKYGLVGFTHALQTELAGSGVGCSVVCPGFVVDDGMYARMAERGVKAPAVMGTTTPQKVASAVVSAIEHNRVEVLVNGTPPRAMIVLASAAPSLVSPLTRLSGVAAMFRKASEEAAAADD